MSTTIYAPKYGIDGEITIGDAGSTASGGIRLEYISGPSLTITREQEELDMVITGMVKAYLGGKIDIGITFTMKNFQTEEGAYPSDISKVMSAFSSGEAVSVYVSDSSLGNIDGDFIVSKMDETRENGKVISWSVELKPTFVGRKVEWSQA